MGRFRAVGPSFAFFAAMAETERENIREATLEGLNSAARKGNHGGRPPVITEDMLQHYAVTATWDELSDKLLKRYGGIADRVIMYFAERQWRRDPKMLDRWAEVARDVRARSAAN